MAIVPLKQTVTITKSGGLDGWGKPVAGDEITLKARVTENTHIVTNQAGEEAVASLRVTLDKLADISYDDTLNYVNENGVTVSRRPLRIEIKRGISGNPILTEVSV